MRGRNFTYSMEVNGHRFDTLLTCFTSGRTEYWSIEMPAVEWILDRLEAGAIDVPSARDELRRATSWDSGCCGECDDAATHYDEARSRHAQIVQQWMDKRAQLSPDDYPYLLNKGKIHRFDCRRLPRSAPPQFPGNLHAFAVLFDGCSGNLDSVFRVLDDQSLSPQPASMADVSLMMAREGVPATESRLCGACKPCLPDLNPSAPAVQPACWSWAADPAVLKELRMIAADEPSDAVDLLPEQQVAYAMLEYWHKGRCAICGQAPVRGLARDHDHASGLIRGLLCSACNTAEGRSDSWLFRNYRQRPPAAILATQVPYLPKGFHPGTRHLTMPTA